MNISKRLVFMCLVVFLLLAGCGTAGNPTPIIITATPGMEPTTIVITATPAPADPTPTQEVGQYVVVNANPRFAGVSEFRLPSDDSLRYQVVGEGYTPTARYYFESGVRVAPYINREPVNNGSGEARLLMEFVQIAGEFGLMTRQTFSAGQCYILKQRGYLRLGPGDMNNLALGARVYLADNGSALELQEQSFPVRNGSYEITWRLRPVENVSTNIEVYLMVRWAEFSAIAEAAESFLGVDGIEVDDGMMLDYYLSQAPAVNEIESFEVILAPQAECPSGATWEW
ncbi:MAG: hypothetical protein RLP44_02585 [Aggregatilineales bacterium]